MKLSAEYWVWVACEYSAKNTGADVYIWTNPKFQSVDEYIAQGFHFSPQHHFYLNATRTLIELDYSQYQNVYMHKLTIIIDWAVSLTASSMVAPASA